MKPNFISSFVAAAFLVGLSLSPAQAGTWVKRTNLTDVQSCATGYIPVPAYTLPDTTFVPSFCVMKYEAKKSSRVPGDRTVSGTNAAYATSSAAELPWVNLTQQDAKAACTATGAALIGENQWLSISFQVANVASNWSGGAVGTGVLYSGHNDNAPAAALEADPVDANGYANTGNTTGSNQRRTLTLPNGQVIWDLAGNVWEWTDSTIIATSRPYDGGGAWREYSASPLVLVNKKPPSTYTSAQGMGQYYPGAVTGFAYNNVNELPDSCTGYCANSAAFLRGGGWYNGVYTGAFTLHLGNGRSGTGTNVGFRCTR